MVQADITKAMENLSSSSAGSGMGSLGGLFLALKSVSCASTLSALPMVVFLCLTKMMVMRMRLRMAHTPEDKLVGVSFQSKMNPGDAQYSIQRCADPDFPPPHRSLHVSIDGSDAL